MGAGDFPLIFARSYNTINLVNDGTVPERIGASWRGFYDRAVIQVPQGVRVSRPDGRSLGFTLQSGNWVGSSDVSSTLTQLTAAGGSLSGWKYVTGNDMVEIYDATGKLLSISTRSGLTQTLNYDSAGRLARVVDPAGRTLSFSYDAQNRVSALTDPAGGYYLYSYDTNGNLVSVQYPDNTRRQYLYENTSYPHAMTGLIDQNGVRFATWTYDASGRATSSVLANSAENVTLAYNPGYTTVTDALGTKRVHYFQTIGSSLKNVGVTVTCASCSSMSSNATYDSNGYVASRSDFNGNVTTYTYNSRGLQTSRTEAVGTALARTITTAWHPAFRLPVQITTPTAVINLSYDTQGNLTQRTVSANGQSRVWHYSYNAQGLVTQIQDPRTDGADITRLSYDTQGNLNKVTNALNQALTITSFDANGRPLSLVDANGLTVNLTYDVRGRLIAKTVGTETTAVTRNPVGMVTKVQLPNGLIHTYQYDAAHRLTYVNDNTYNQVEYKRDAASNIVKANLFNPNVAATRSFAYDPLGRMASATGAYGQTTQFVRDNNGNVLKIAAPLNRSTEFTYDALNRSTSVTDPLNGLTALSYDVNSLLTQVADPRNLTTRYTRDGFGEVTQIASPDTGNTLVTYDSAGLLATTTNARGITATYTRDVLNRVTQINYGGGGVTPEAISFTYDTGPNALGRLVQINDPSGSTRWSYDAHGRVVGKTQTVGSFALSLAYGYASSGRLASMTLPSGKVVQYGYMNGRVSSATYNGQPLINNVRYRAFGPVTAWSLPGLTDVSRTFDLSDRTSSYSLGSATRALGYDDANRITSISDNLTPAANQSLSYDSLDRIVTAATTGSTDSYSYDPLGNRLTKSSAQGNSAYQYAPTSNALTAIASSIGTPPPISILRCGRQSN